MNKLGLIVLSVAIVTVCGETPLRFRQRSQQSRAFQRQELAPSSDDSNGYPNAPYPPSGWRPSGARLELPSRQVAQPTTTKEVGTTTTEFNQETTTGSNQNAYPAAGFQPETRFNLPSEGETEQPEPIAPEVPDQQSSASFGSPQQEYGPPAQEYGPPASEYGPPQEAESSGDEELAPTGNPEAEELEIDENQEFKVQAEQRQQKNENEQAEEIQPQTSNPGAYFVQLADGSVQRVVYLTPNDVTASRLQIRPVAQSARLISPVLVPQFVSYPTPLQNANYQISYPTAW